MVMMSAVNKIPDLTLKMYLENMMVKEVHTFINPPLSWIFLIKSHHFCHKCFECKDTDNIFFRSKAIVHILVSIYGSCYAETLKELYCHKKNITTSFLVTIAGEGKDQLTTYNSPKYCTGSGFHVSVCNSRCSLLTQRWDEPWTQGWGGLGSPALFPLSGSGQRPALIGPDRSRDLSAGLWLAAGLLRPSWAGTQCTCDTEPPPRPRQSLLGRQMLGRSGVTTCCLFPGFWLVRNVQDRPLIGRCRPRGYRARGGNKKTWML